MYKMRYSPHALRGVLRVVPMTLLALATAACDAGAPLLSGEQAAATLSGFAPLTDPGQQLARALAGAMGQTQVRAHVFNALQESPFVEHKLVLGTFAGTPQGAQVLRAAAQHAGVDVSTIRGWIAVLPEMDLYVPLRVQRRTWQGTEDFVVGLNRDSDDTGLTGYRPDGSVVRLDARDGVPSTNVILLHPAEPKALRRQAPPTGSRHTIENGVGAQSDDGCIYPTGGGDVTVQTVCGGDGSGSGGTSGYTGGLIYGFENYIADGWGLIELMVKTYTDSLGTRLDEEIMSEGGSCYPLVGCTDGWSYPQRPITMGNTQTFIKVWERDSGSPEWGSDDFWGQMYFQGYPVNHHFLASCNEVGLQPAPSPCDGVDPNWRLYKTVSVTIKFAHQTNASYDIY